VLYRDMSGTESSRDDEEILHKSNPLLLKSRLGRKVNSSIRQVGGRSKHSIERAIKMT